MNNLLITAVAYGDMGLWLYPARVQKRHAMSNPDLMFGLSLLVAPCVCTYLISQTICHTPTVWSAITSMSRRILRGESLQGAFRRLSVHILKCSLVSLVLAFTACGRCGSGTYYLNGIRGYSGDGAINDASASSGLFGTRGYVIDFPKFDLGQEYEAAYHFSNIPTLGGRAPAEIALMIEAPRGFLPSSVDQLKASLKATLKCSLADSSGKVITEFEVR